MPKSTRPILAPDPAASLHVVQYSGGVGSFWAAKRVAAAYGTENLRLLFADTQVEDPDLHRWLDDSSAHLGVPVITVADGRTPFEVFADERFLGNSRVAPCSHHLKIVPCRRWLEANADPADTVLYIGIDSFEAHRVPGIAEGWSPWRTRFPMCEEPYVSKEEMLADARELGLRTPLLYDLGFKHNNCGGACVRAGQGLWKNLLRVFPDRYAHNERKEQQLREELGDFAILRSRRVGASRPLPLTELRARAEAEGRQGDLFGHLPSGAAGGAAA